MSREKSMPLYQALQILVEHTKNDCIGQGCGIRSIPSYDEKEKIAKAFKRVWRLAFSYNINMEQARNHTF